MGGTPLCRENQGKTEEGQILTEKISRRCCLWESWGVHPHPLWGRPPPSLAMLGFTHTLVWGFTCTLVRGFTHTLFWAAHPFQWPCHGGVHPNPVLGIYP